MIVGSLTSQNIPAQRYDIISITIIICIIIAVVKIRVYSSNGFW